MPETPKPTNSELLRQCIDWNAAYPPGTYVRYFAVSGRDQYTVESTDGLAFILGDHTAVVRLRHMRGCFALDNMQPMDPPEAAAE